MSFKCPRATIFDQSIHSFSKTTTVETETLLKDFGLVLKTLILKPYSGH